jgi:hypothetical protein
MKNLKGLIGLAAFIVCLGAVLVTTYAKQVATAGEKNAILHVMQNTCSSSSSSSSSNE